MRTIGWLLIFTLLCVIFPGKDASPEDNKNQFVAKGYIESLTDTFLSLYIWDSKALNGSRTMKIPVKNGSFEFTGDCDEPMMVRGWIKDERVTKRAVNGFYPVKSAHVWFIIYPGAKVTINGRITDYTEAFPSDGGENDILSSLTRRLFPVLNESVNCLRRSKTEKDLTSAQIRELEEKVKKTDQKAVEILKSFLGKHASSVAALWFMDDMLIRSQIDPAELEKFFRKVDPKYHGTSYYKTVKAKIEGSKNTVVGSVVPEVISNDTPDGSYFDLKNLRGKYVIIDFWGTWCGPCLKGMPAMRAFRDKNRSTVEILGIAKDSNIDAWKREIVNAKLNWYHILNGTGERDFVARFNVQGYPTKIVIDPDGKIIYRETDENEKFYSEVEKLINK